MASELELYKPTIFIGSSINGLPIAELVSKHLSDLANCKIWNNDAFDFGKSYFENILDLSPFFDYGIFIITASDINKDMLGELEGRETRDNLLLEIGMFLGQLGREKSFFLAEKEAMVPSSLINVSLTEFTSKDANDLDGQIEERCERIKKLISHRSGYIFNSGILPSIPLAFGYFHNSMLPLCRQMAQSATVKIDGKEMNIETFSIRVLIPNNLRGSMKEKVEAVKSRDKWKQVEVPTTATRSFNFYVQESALDIKHLVILDIPTTLDSLYQTISEFVGSGTTRQSLKEELTIHREIRQFRKVLDYLADTNPFSKGKIITEITHI